MHIHVSSYGIVDVAIVLITWSGWTKKHCSWHKCFSDYPHKRQNVADANFASPDSRQLMLLNQVKNILSSSKQLSSAPLFSSLG